MKCPACSKAEQLYGEEAALEYVFGKDKCTCTFLGPANRRTMEVQFQLSNSRPIGLYCKAGCCDLLNEQKSSDCKDRHIFEKRGWRHLKRW